MRRAVLQLLHRGLDLLAQCRRGGRSGCWLSIPPVPVQRNSSSSRRGCRQRENRTREIISGQDVARAPLPAWPGIGKVCARFKAFRKPRRLARFSCSLVTVVGVINLALAASERIPIEL